MVNAAMTFIQERFEGMTTDEYTLDIAYFFIGWVRYKGWIWLANIDVWV